MVTLIRCLAQVNHYELLDRELTAHRRERLVILAINNTLPSVLARNSWFILATQGLKANN